MKESDVKKQFIVFGEDWNRHPSSTQHIFHHFLSDNFVCWVNSIGLRRPRFSDGKRILEKIRQIFNASENEFNQESLGPQPQLIIAPIVIPWPGNRLFARINCALLRTQLSKHLKMQASSEYVSRILWLSLPTAQCVVNALEEDLVIYYAGDNFAALKGVDNEAVSRDEQDLVARADIILAASPDIAKLFPPQKTHLLPHGVDLSLFSASTEKPQLSSKFGGRYDQTVGYYGSISSWLDFELIKFLANARPDVRFLFIGRIETDVGDLFELENVFHLPDQPHNKLVEYASNWQVSLIPFRINEQIKACNPLKLREYLAIGNPIISTLFPAVAEYDDLALCAESHEEMLNHLNTALSLTQHQQAILLDNSRRRVSEESWLSRSLKIERIIDEVLADKHAKHIC